MLGFIRKNANSVWVKAGLCLVACTFLFFFGMSDVINKITGNDYVVKVGDVKIGPNLFKFEARRTAERLRKVGVENEDAVVNMTMHKMIDDELTKQLMAAYGISVDNDLVKMYMYSIPAFRNEKGEFDKRIVRSVMMNAKMSEPEFVEYLRDNIKHSILGVTLRSYEPKFPISVFSQAFFSRRDARYVYIPYESFAQVSYNDDDLEEFYNANTSKFMIDETRDFVVLMIDEEELKKDINISEEEIMSEFKARSEDADISTKRDEIRSYLADSALSEKVSKLIRDIEDDFAAGDSIQNIVKKYSIKQSDFVGMNRNYTVPSGSTTSLPFMDAVLKTAFALELNNESTFVEGRDRQNKKVYWLVKNTKITPQHPKPFSAVKSGVANMYLKHKQKEAAAERAKAYVSEIDSGVIIDYIAEKSNYKLYSLGNIGRFDKCDDKKFKGKKFVTKELIDAVFATPVLHAGTIAADDGVILFEVINVYAEKNADKEKITQISSRTYDNCTSELFYQLKMFKKQQLGVKVNEKLMKSDSREIPDIDF